MENKLKKPILWFVRQLSKGCLVKPCNNTYCFNNKNFKTLSGKEVLALAIKLV
jgi:hypothetical protein